MKSRSIFNWYNINIGDEIWHESFENGYIIYKNYESIIWQNYQGFIFIIERGWDYAMFGYQKIGKYEWSDLDFSTNIFGDPIV